MLITISFGGQRARRRARHPAEHGIAVVVVVAGRLHPEAALLKAVALPRCAHRAKRERPR
jgi:hypothetical protein